MAGGGGGGRDRAAATAKAAKAAAEAAEAASLRGARDRATAALAARAASEEEASELEKAVFAHVVARCRARRYVAARHRVPASWGCFWFRHLYASTAQAVARKLGDAVAAGMAAERGRGLAWLIEHPTFEEWKDADPQRWRRAARVAERRTDPSQMPDGILQCPRCRSKKTEYYQRQIRSADEPMTTFARCRICDKRWKGD